MAYYAHTRGPARADWQTLQEHLSATAELARQIGAATGLADYAAAAAQLHDLGKYSLAFQRRLEGAPGRVDHSTAGAVEIKKLTPEPVREWIGQMLAYCIAGHHGGLPDAGSAVDTADTPSLAGRLKRAGALEDYSAWRAEVDPASLRIPGSFPRGFRPLRNAAFSCAFATRMMYSILVDADYLDTEAFCGGAARPRGGYPDLPSLAAAFDRRLQQFAAPDRPINRRRSAALQACLEQAGQPGGFFRLTLPTGAGKTLTSMAFALRHAVLHGMERIIYVIPYTSIIEQNAAVFKNSLADRAEAVLEHHSTFDWDAARESEQTNRQDSAAAKLKWAAENWDIPIVVTTNVQFFESLFANRSSRARKVHNMAKSVVILDEAQMLPVEFMTPCLMSLAELVRNYGCSAVFCTATQPELERFLPDEVKPVRELTADPQAEFDFYRRVRVHLPGKLADADLLERLNGLAQVLCIVNTRRHARALFAGLRGEGCFHLSTLMCAAHRRQVIAEIRRRLAEGLPCRVVSTQLLEAGVDLDFPVGYRALAGLDSIVQAAGRVNREGNRPEGQLYVFSPEDAYTRRMPKTIRQCAAVAGLVLQQHAQDPISTAAIRAYYNQLYAQHDARSFDSREIMQAFQMGKQLTFDFAAAAERFKLIEDDTQAVIVPFDDTARGLIEELRRTAFPLSVVRKLQPYTVNVYQPEFRRLQAAGLIAPAPEVYPVLVDTPETYTQETGLAVPEADGGLAVFTEY
jgi:CRISPR-associated helicase Cas3/CRISPR-associated endonuclease Cas3-HD